MTEKSRGERPLDGDKALLKLPFVFTAAKQSGFYIDGINSYSLLVLEAKIYLLPAMQCRATQLLKNLPKTLEDSQSPEAIGDNSSPKQQREIMDLVR